MSSMNDRVEASPFILPHEEVEPVVGCWVGRRLNDGCMEIAPVMDKRLNSQGRWEVLAQWRQGARWEVLGKLLCGLQPGHVVQHVPFSNTRASLGVGTVRAVRQLAGQWQALVQLHDTGEPRWLPFERLKRLRDVGMRYNLAMTGQEPASERFRLKFLAHALDSWNRITGALDRLDIDPLPHQIHLVHTILSSGNWNWLIADDVGLGKTIEVGLLLAALKRQGHARRVLIVAPPGLVRQWQDEMKFKFGQEYLIYGRDFAIHDAQHWKLYDHVIVSLDRAKQDEHMAIFRQAPGWDMIIFDEAHKLSRHERAKTQRYKLAEMLRGMSDHMILLSATPHQGYDDRFRHLLKLVRPDLRKAIDLLKFNPQIVADVILRNRKSQVTDAQGNFIFKGLQVKRVAIAPAPAMQAFDRQLRDYLREGYRVAEGGSQQERAIGFVMTTFRKLAASSVAAIERALRKRLEKLTGSAAPVSSWKLDAEEEREALEGRDDLDDEVQLTEVGGLGTAPFFADEALQLQRLLHSLAKARQDDRKLATFLEEIAAPLVREDKKLLIFTEYRGTQEYLKEALEKRFPQCGPVMLINGSMNLDAKMDAIARFRNEATFLISTEAGGEGLNLHEACHIMVNYDLPWNPARLVQRMGRLYRYGQQETVIVFNLLARDGFDNIMLGTMLERVEAIAQDMAHVSGEFHDNLAAEILGELLDNLDMVSILRQARDFNPQRTEREVQEALEKARQARQMQEELLKHATSFDPAALRDGAVYGMEHVMAFVRGMLPLLGIAVRQELHGGKALEIRLPEKLVAQFGEFRRQSVVRITSDRRLAQRYPQYHLLDFESPFFRYLVKMAQGPEFDGAYACVRSAEAEATGTLAGFRLRWQNDQGDIVHDEFVALWRTADGKVVKNPKFLPRMLLKSFADGVLSEEERQQREAVYQTLASKAEELLKHECTLFRQPNDLVALMAADVQDGTNSHVVPARA